MRERDPRTHERKEHGQLQASAKVCVPIGSGLVVRTMRNENPMRVDKVDRSC